MIGEGGKREKENSETEREQIREMERMKEVCCSIVLLRCLKQYLLCHDLTNLRLLWSKNFNECDVSTGLLRTLFTH